jgi:hypothetical protein
MGDNSSGRRFVNFRSCRLIDGDERVAVLLVGDDHIVVVREEDADKNVEVDKTLSGRGFRSFS